MNKISVSIVLIIIGTLLYFASYALYKSSNESNNVSNCANNTITAETTESVVSKSIYEVYQENTIKLLDTLKSTEYKTVTVNGRSYNILGYLDDFNNRDKLDVIDCMYNSFLGRNLVQYIESSKALVLLDIPIVYTDDDNVTNMLDSYNVLAVINDDGCTEATITPIVIVSDEGKVVGVHTTDYTELTDTFPVDYQRLIDTEIIEQPTSEHWSVS